MADQDTELVQQGETALKDMLVTCTDLNDRLKIRRALRRIRCDGPTNLAVDAQPVPGDNDCESNIRRVISLHETRTKQRSSIKYNQPIDFSATNNGNDNNNSTHIDSDTHDKFIPDEVKRRRSLNDDLRLSSVGDGEVTNQVSGTIPTANHISGNSPASNHVGGTNSAANHASDNNPAANQVGGTIPPVKQKLSIDNQNILCSNDLMKMDNIVQLNNILRESRDFEERRLLRARIRELKEAKSNQASGTKMVAPTTDDVNLACATIGELEDMLSRSVDVIQRRRLKNAIDLKLKHHKAPNKSKEVYEHDEDDVFEPTSSTANSQRLSGAVIKDRKAQTQSDRPDENGLEVRADGPKEGSKHKHKHKDGEDRKHKPKSKDKDRETEDGDKKQRKHKNKDKRDGEEERELKQKKNKKDKDKDKKVGKKDKEKGWKLKDLMKGLLVSDDSDRNKSAGSQASSVSEADVYRESVDDETTLNELDMIDLDEQFHPQEQERLQTQPISFIKKPDSTSMKIEMIETNSVPGLIKEHNNTVNQSRRENVIVPKQYNVLATKDSGLRNTNILQLDRQVGPNIPLNGQHEVSSTKQTEETKLVAPEIHVHVSHSPKLSLTPENELATIVESSDNETSSDTNEIREQRNREVNTADSAGITQKTSPTRTEYSEDKPLGVSTQSGKPITLAKSSSMPSIKKTSLTVPGQRPVRRHVIMRDQHMEKSEDPNSIIDMNNLEKMITSAEDQDRRREIRCATRALKNEIKSGGWVVNGKFLIGKMSGISVTTNDNTVEIHHLLGVGENQQKVTLCIKTFKNDADEDEYLLTSSISKTRYLDDGHELEETDEIKTRRRLTSRGSIYLTRDSKKARTLRNVVGHEFIDEKITTEVQEDSVSRQEKKHDKVTQRTMLQSLTRASDEEDEEEVRPAPRKKLPRPESFIRQRVHLDIVKPPENIELEAGHTARFVFTINCSVTLPDIAWYFAGEEVSESADVKMNYNNGEVELIIGHVSRDDVGRYKCIVKAGSQEIEVSATLSLNDVKNVETQVPVIIEGLSEKIVRENDEVTLECKLNDAPDVTVQWFKGKKLLKNDHDFRQIIDRNLAQLILATVYPEDTGEYTCLVSNTYGKAETKCDLKVKTDDDYEASVGSVEPEFIQPLSNQTRKDQERVVFSCEVIGQPKPNITWYKDGTRLPNSDVFCQIYDGLTAKLTLSELFGSDTGSFKCVAENKAGKKISRANLIIMGRHEPPALDAKVPAQSAIIKRTASAPMTSRPKPRALIRNTTEKDIDENQCDNIIKPVATSPDKLGERKHSVPSPPLRGNGFVHDSSKSAFTRIRTPPSSPEGNNNSDIKFDKHVTEPSHSSDTAQPSKLIEPKHINTLMSHISDSKTQIPSSLNSVSYSDDSIHDTFPVNENITNETRIERVNHRQTPGHPVMYIPLPDERTASTGKRLVLTCECMGSPVPEITWNRAGKLLPHGSDYKQTYNGRTAKLVIDKLFSNDEGVYTCVATNITGHVTSSCCVKVYGDTGSRRQSIVPAQEPHPLLAGTNIENQDVIMKALEKVHELAIKQQNKDWGLDSDSDDDKKIDDTTPQMATYNQKSKDENHNDESDLTDEKLVSKSLAQKFEQRFMKRDSVAETLTPSRPKIFNRSLSFDIAAAKSIFENRNSPILCRESNGRDSRGSPAENLNSPVLTLKSPVLNLSSPVLNLNSAVPNRNSQVLGPDSPVSILPDKKFVVNSGSNDAPIPKTRYNLKAKQAFEQISHQPPSALKPPADKTPTKLQMSDVSFCSPLNNRVKRSSSKVGDIINMFASQVQPNSSAPVARSRSLNVHRKSPWTREGDGGWIKDQSDKSLPETTTGSIPPVKMSDTDVDTITDEARLQQMLNDTQDFDERKKIRSRIRDIRDQERDDRENARLQREKDRGDSVQAKMLIATEGKSDLINKYKEISIQPDSVRADQRFTEDHVKELSRQSEEQKKKRLEEMNQGVSTSDRLVSIHSDNLVKLRAMEAEEAKKRKLRAFGNIAKTESLAKTETIETTDGVTQKTSVTTTQRDGGGVTTTRQEKTSSTVSGFGTQYGHAAKPAGAKGAMAAFKQMDGAANPGGAKPNLGGGGGRAVGVQRSPSTIKQMLLSWCQYMVRPYQNVNITNFSSSWSDGIAFCALIHHFHPEAFKFEELDPKRRRHNFTLAFDTAEKFADIAPLLDVEDMVRMKNPDWKCVFTYVQSFYRKFREHECEVHKKGGAPPPPQ